MYTTRMQLISRKEALFSAIRALEQDYADGVMGVEAYRTARYRFELEAASVLERLDGLPADAARDSTRRDDRTRVDQLPVLAQRNRRARAVVLLAGGLVVVALTLLLSASLHGRTSGPASVGRQPDTLITSPSTRSPRVVAAEQAVRRRPGSVDALLALARAYSDGNDVGSADRVYLQAMKIDPRRPEAPTLHALVLAARKQYDRALALLRLVEQRNPTYARAWLTDGLVASRRRPGYARAVSAWNRFLALMPHSSLSPAVRGYIAALKRAEATHE